MNSGQPQKLYKLSLNLSRTAVRYKMKSMLEITGGLLQDKELNRDAKVDIKRFKRKIDKLH